MMSDVQENPRDPMEQIDPIGKAARCKATNRSGKRCGKPAIDGGSVCRLHGGAAPQVRRAAELRILKMVSPALVELGKLILKADSDSVRMRAIKDVLDRAGLAPITKLAHEGKDGEALFSVDAVRKYMQEEPDDEPDGA